MKIVIDLDEKYYNDIKNSPTASNYSTLYALFGIRNGTPLPKGHGRLIDADYLREDFKASRKISFAERMDISCIVDHAPTIIEADIEEDVDKAEDFIKWYSATLTCAIKDSTPLQEELEEIKAEAFKRAKRCDTQKDYDYGYHTAMTDIGDIIEERIKELKNDL